MKTVLEQLNESTRACFLGVLAAAFYMATPDSSLAQVPGVINYQGRVVVNGTNFTGTGQFKFALVDGTGATTFWSNDGTASGEPATAVSVSVTKGLYSVLLGQSPMVAISPAVFTNADVRLRVWFDGGNGMLQLAPDQRIGAVGYALAVPGSGVVGSIPDAQLGGVVNIDPTGINDGLLGPALSFGARYSGEGIASKRTAGGNQNGLDFYADWVSRMSISHEGKVGIGIANPQANLTVHNPGSADPISALDIDVASFGTSSNAAASHYLRMRDMGAGTAFIFTGDGKLGVGTGTPQENLEVAGRVVVADSANANPKAGTIRWTGTDFQGYDGGRWLSLTIPPPVGMVLVPSGTFTMGSAAMGGDAIPEHQVTLSSFCLSRCEVTYALWCAVRQWALANGYFFQNAGREGNTGTDGATPTANSGQPVTSVSWRDAIVWCNARSAKEGLASVYTYTNAAIRDSRNSNATACDNAVFNQDLNGYRLPTEAEWQYAARYIDGWSWTAGDYASGAGFNYSNEPACDAVAWYSANSSNTTHAAGTKKPNQLGIFDMSGNVREWCWDWYAAYSSDPATNPTGPLTGSYRLTPAGALGTSPIGLVCSRRTAWETTRVDTYVGLRCARNAQ